MAFTADSVELAKAQKLANQLSALHQTFGATNMRGSTAAKIVEEYAQKLGFGITGLTTGAGFPPFGTVRPALGLGVAAALQNPRGETMASGITLGDVEGATVGIYLRKFVRSGEDFPFGVTRGTSGIAGSTFESYGSGTFVNGGFTACVFFGGVTGSTGTIS